MKYEQENINANDLCRSMSPKEKSFQFGRIKAFYFYFYFLFCFIGAPEPAQHLCHISDSIAPLLTMSSFHDLR